MARILELESGDLVHTPPDLVVPPHAGLSAGFAPPTPQEMLRAMRRPPIAVQLTAVPIRVTSTGAQELRLAFDALELDELDLEVQVLRLEGATPSVTIELQTGMQIESGEGWVSVSAFSAISAAPSAQKRNFANFLRFVRWNVTALSGTAATFLLHGIGRRWA